MIKSKRKFNMRSLPIFILLAFLGFTACQNGDSTANEEENAAEEQSEEMAYSLSPFSASTAYPNAIMESMSFANGQFDFTMSNYELGIQTPDADSKMCANSDKGQHIHLIVDTQPYAAKYEASFPYEIADGEHYLLAFLSRSYHESIKNGSADMAQKVTIENNTITSREDVEAPMLFYSRPKGTYVGKANTDKVMLDFFLKNVDLGDEYMVKAQINDEVHMIDTWQPYYIEGLPMGENLITLTLVDKEGNKVDTPLNPVSRKFTLMEDPAENM